MPRPDGVSRHAVPGATISGLVADFGEPQEIRQLLDALGDLDILVNNVGVFELKPFAYISDEDWQRYFEVNLMSSVRLTRTALTSMITQGVFEKFPNLRLLVTGGGVLNRFFTWANS